MAVTAGEVPREIDAFLLVPTPAAWVEAALERIPAMLLDHANCELKAASTALGFLYRYPERTALAQRMSRLAREELRHFEQVRSIMDDLGVPFERLSASRYAGSLREAVRQDEPYKLLDMLLIVGMLLGIHWAFAPVVDVNNNPDNPVINIRSFGEDPEMVGRLGAAQVDGHIRFANVPGASIERRLRIGWFMSASSTSFMAVAISSTFSIWSRISWFA